MGAGDGLPCPRSDCGKTLRSPGSTGLTTGFDKPVLSEVEGLRANGTGVGIIEDLPFVLSLSKHGHHFFGSPLKQ